jgi:hypothetical protein
LFLFFWEFEIQHLVFYLRFFCVFNIYTYGYKLFLYDCLC